MMEAIRSQVLYIFPAIMMRIYGLIVTSAICMCVWQLLLAELMSAETHTTVESVKALDANLPSEQRSTVGPSLVKE